VAELHNDEEEDSIIFVETPAGPPLPAKPAPVPMAAAVAGSATAVVVDYIGLALQLPAFVIIVAVLALVLLESPAPPPPVAAGVFAVLPMALLSMAPFPDSTTWICSALAVGAALLFHYFRSCIAAHRPPPDVIHAPSAHVMAKVPPPGPGHSPVSCKPPPSADLADAYDLMVYPLVHYACFWCGALFSAPAFDEPVCDECGYDSFNAARFSFVPWTSRCRPTSARFTVTA
jgi:hypothetical protein